MEKRTRDRIDVHLSGYLDWAKDSLSITVVNISPGGACLSLNPSDWEKIEAQESLVGAFIHQKRPVPFRANVRWSSTNHEQTLVGMAFLPDQLELFATVLEIQPGHEPFPQEGSFNL